MHDSMNASSSGFVGRTAVVIPALDVGVVTAFHDSLTLPNGHENGLQAEIIAVKHADDICQAKGLRNLVIYTDNGDAARNSDLPYVRLIPPERWHPADEYLYKMRSRAGYIRRSTGKVKRRRPLTPINDEIARLMMTERVEFKLSESPLYQEFKAEAE